MQSIRSFGLKGKRKLLSFLFISQCVCLRTWSWGIIGGEGTGLKLHYGGDSGISVPIQSSSSSLPALRAIVHLHSSSSDLKEGTQQDNEASSSSSLGLRRSYLESGDDAFSTLSNEETEGGESIDNGGSSDTEGDNTEVTFISEKEEEKNKRNMKGVDENEEEDQQAFFSALQVNESSGLGTKSSEKVFSSSSDSQKSSVPPPPQCACEFAVCLREEKANTTHNSLSITNEGNCLPKGSCLSIAFTLTGALLIVVIFIAWALQWIIAIPSEWIIAKGRYSTKASSSSSGQQAGSGKEEEGRLLGEEKKSQAFGSSLSDGEQKNLVSEEDDEETARRIAEGAGLPPPSRTESGRL